ncbi:MAG: N-acetylmuramidase family protein [Candidatus Kapaibacterium sp.]
MAKPTLTDQDFQDAANMLGCNVAAIKAVSEVESRQKGFYDNGEPVILFERHIFSKYTNHMFDKTNPDISNPKPGGYGPSSAQHARLQEAVKLNRNAALMSASWGKFQIMGFNFALAGFTSLQEFINAMYTSERDHLMAFVQYVKHCSLDDELRNKQWAEFAKRYNGVDYKKNNYDTKLAAAYTKYGGK